MRRTLNTALATLALSAAALLNAGVAEAAPAQASYGVSVVSQADSPSAGSTPTSSASTTEPVDPGTGETRQAKETRVDYAPYVIGAVVVVVLAAAAIVLRRRGGPSSKGPRRDNG